MLSAAAALIRALAEEHRRVLSEWRALILLRRATLSLGRDERRWSSLPHDIQDIRPTLRAMRRRGDIEPIPKLDGLYIVTVPYARNGPIDEHEILMELQPYATVSHLSAMVFHGLTNELPKSITATAPARGTSDELPIGTLPTDWEGISVVRGRTPAAIMGHPIQVRGVGLERYFGFRLYAPHGVPVRVTTPERTVLDGLDEPVLCGGIENVLLAWTRAVDILDLETLIAYADRFNIGVLKQRVGFIVDELGLAHPALERWQAAAQRGGTSKLLASAPYAPEFSERWNLSINTSIAALHQ
jgi:predicted transcriptional regulator of viral defense system